MGLFSKLFGGGKKTARRTPSPTTRVDSSNRSVILDRHFAIGEDVNTKCIPKPRTDACISAAKAQIAMQRDVAAEMKRQRPDVKKQIRHVGHDNLFQAYMERQQWTDAIHAAQDARDNNWKGDWTGRIARAKSKAKKSS